MADPFVAEIRPFAFNFAPRGWATCDGQLMPLAQNTALYSLLGTVYGGNGVNNFALPNLADRTPLQPGQGSGLSQRFQGEVGGVAEVTLTANQVPAHTHGLRHAGVATSAVPGPSSAFGSTGVAQVYAAAVGTPVPMLPQAVATVGAGLPHNNRQPYLVLNFCIALQGVFPPRP